MMVSDEARQRTAVGVKRAKVQVPHVRRQRPEAVCARAPAPCGLSRPRTTGRQLVVKRLGASRSRCGRQQLQAALPAFTTRS